MAVQAEKELAEQQMSAEEVQRRHDAMAKNSALLFYQEQKAKRVKKIKSKVYHRHLKKQSEKARALLATNDLDDPAELQVLPTHTALALCWAPQSWLSFRVFTATHTAPCTG